MTKSPCKTPLAALVVLMILLLTSPGALAAPVVNLSPAQAYKMLKQNSDIYLLDVRTPQEYMQMRIEGARLIPIEQFLRRQKEVPADRPVVVYCAVGARSSEVANYLVRQGYATVYNMYGGIYGWQLRGYPLLSGMP